MGQGNSRTKYLPKATYRKLSVGDKMFGAGFLKSHESVEKVKRSRLFGGWKE
jgi:hypothetical protein